MPLLAELQDQLISFRRLVFPLPDHRQRDFDQPLYPACVEQLFRASLRRYCAWSSFSWPFGINAFHEMPYLRLVKGLYMGLAFDSIA
jgi:hypothetical protein